MSTLTKKKKPAQKPARKPAARRKTAVLIRDPISGLMVAPAVPGRKPITSEDVARASADFP